MLYQPVGGHVIQLIHVFPVRHRQDLGDVQHRAAANGYHPTIAGLGCVGQDGVHHHIGGLPGTVLLLIDHVTAQAHLTKVGLVDVLVGQNQIALCQLEFLDKFVARGIAVQLWLHDNLHHIALILSAFQCHFLGRSFRNHSKCKPRAKCKKSENWSVFRDAGPELAGQNVPN